MGSALLTEPGATTDVVHLSINTIRTLCIDAVAQAKSGHPRGADISTQRKFHERHCRLTVGGAVCRKFLPR